ncbi:MAG: potassium-transporting ATPase subunit KdpC [Alphaproteobacteria bacterium]|nr:potassium-transporting ATPase subunit KdpC [Alphaproteobacteria bacterium]
MFQELRASLSIVILFTLITGLAYPWAMTGLGQSLFRHQANGSLVTQGDTIIGSELIGQNFTTDRYFHGRPSAAGDGYDAANSSGSNEAPTAPDFIKAVAARAAALRANGSKNPIPADLLTASGSGLDPDISVAAAQYEAPRVAAARGLPAPQVMQIIAQNTRPRTLGFIGEPRVNVLALNRAIDMLETKAP